MDKIAWSGNDEFYTPLYAIVPIIKYLKQAQQIWRPIKIWCPFDTNESNFVRYLSKIPWNIVVNTHISNWEDFFEIIKDKNSEIMSCDYIISNPPYSMKWEVFKALFESWKSFAMLVWVVWLFESKKRFDMFKNNTFEIMYLDKRVSYFKNYQEQKPSLNPPFSSIYLCSKVLPEKIVFENILK